MNVLIRKIEEEIEKYCTPVEDTEEAKVLKGITPILSNPYTYISKRPDPFQVVQALMITYIPNMTAEESSQYSDTMNFWYNKMRNKNIQDSYKLLDLIKKMHNDYSNMLDVFKPDSPYYRRPESYLKKFESNRPTAIYLGPISNVRRLRKHEKERIERKELLYELINYTNKYLDGDYEKLSAIAAYFKKTSNYPVILQTYTDLILNPTDEVLKSFREAIENKLNKLDNKKRKKTEENIAKASKYEELKSKLSSVRDDEVVTPSMIQGIGTDNLELIEAFYMYALEHNEKIYDSLSINKVNEIDALFDKYGFSITNFSDEIREKIYNISIIRLEDFLSYCSSKPIAIKLLESPMVVDIIKNAEMEDIDNVVSLINDGIIHINSIVNNPEIVFNYPLILENIDTLKKAKIDLLSLTTNDSNLLLLEKDKLLTTLSLLCSYMGTGELRGLNNFNILQDPRYFDAIDMFIENDIYEDFLQNPNIIDKNYRNTILSMLIARSIGYNYKNEDGTIKRDVLDIKRFRQKLALGDDKLEAYVPTYDPSNLNPKYLIVLNNNPNIKIDNNILDVPIVRLLENTFKRDELTYQINNVVISRNKVLRYLTTLDVGRVNYEEAIDMTFNSVIINKVMDNDTVIGIQEKLTSTFRHDLSKDLIKTSNN